MNKYGFAKQNAVVNRMIVSSVSLSLVFLSVGTLKPQFAHADNGVVRTPLVSTEQRSYHLRFVNEEGKVIYQTDVAALPGKPANLPAVVRDALTAYTDKADGTSVLSFWTPPTGQDHYDIKVYPRVTRNKLAKNLKFVFNCHFADRPTEQKIVNVICRAEEYFNHLTREDKIINRKFLGSSVNGDHIVIPSFTNYQLAPKSVQEVSLTKMMTRVSDYDHPTKSLSLEPLDLFFINNNGSAGQDQPVNPGKKDDSSSFGKPAQGHDESTGEDQSKDDGHPDTGNDATQTNSDKPVDDGNQTDEPASKDDVTQTDDPSTKDGGTQTAPGRDEATQTDSEIAKGSAKDETTQTEPSRKVDDGSQTDESTGKDGTKGTDSQKKDDHVTDKETAQATTPAKVIDIGQATDTEVPAKGNKQSTNQLGQSNRQTSTLDSSASKQAAVSIPDQNQSNQASPNQAGNASTVDDRIASDQEKLNELNQMPLSAATTNNNDKLPQLGDHSEKLFSLLGVLMVMASMLGFTKTTRRMNE